MEINPGYIVGQLAKALDTVDTHDDGATRERAREKSRKWLDVLKGVFSGALAIGDRAPVAGIPAWATLDCSGLPECRESHAAGSMVTASAATMRQSSSRRNSPPAGA